MNAIMNYDGELREKFFPLEEIISNSISPYDEISIRFVLNLTRIYITEKKERKKREASTDEIEFGA